MRQPIFYEYITLNSTKQIKQFIELALITNINGISLGHLVKNIYFHKSNIEDLTPHMLASLITLCSFVNTINEISKMKNGEYRILSSTMYWQQLTKIPLSYTKIDSRWLNYMGNLSKSAKKVDRSRVTSISISIDASQYIKISKNTYSKMEPGDKLHMNLLMVQDRKDCILPRRYNDAIHYKNMVVFNSYYLKLPQSFNKLKELYLDFKEFNVVNNHCYYKFNEATLESISTTCSSLTHLTLCYFNFNLSSEYSSFRSYTCPLTPIDYKGLKPSFRLQWLHLEHCYLHEPGCYRYIQYKYPNLNTLNLDLIYLPIMNEYHCEYNSAIDNLIASCTTLTNLYIYYTNYCTKCYVDECDEYHIVDNLKFWPREKIQSWLLKHPNQLFLSPDLFESLNY
ncbi:unnamed protein product [Cunninghamella blakesleeana]